MADTRHITTTDGRSRVAYEMALAMWTKTKEDYPGIDDQTEFLKLVKSCTNALAYGSG